MVCEPGSVACRSPAAAPASSVAGGGRRRRTTHRPWDDCGRLQGVVLADRGEAEWEAVLRHVTPGSYEALDRALYLTGVMAGLRHGELCALRWRDVDWVAGRVRVRQNWVLGAYDTPKSRRASRSVPMADRLAAELDRLHQALGEPGPDELVFADPATGEPLDKARNLRRLRKALNAAKVDEGHSVHSLRHTFGTSMAAAGVPLRTLQEWMGHRDLKTTQRYADYAPSPHEHALIGSAFGRGSNLGAPAVSGAKYKDGIRVTDDDTNEDETTDERVAA